MHVSLFLLAIILFFLIILTAFFSASEIGLMSLNRYRLNHLVKKKNHKALRIKKLLVHPEKFLSMILIGSTFANIIASTLATLIGQRLGGDVGVAIATLLLAIIILIFAELIPKTLAALEPQKMAFSLSWPLKIMSLCLSPLVSLFSHTTHLFLKFLGLGITRKQQEALTSEEIRSVIHESGLFSRAEYKDMLIKLLDLEQLPVEDIMIPKSDIIGLDIQQPWHELLIQLKTAQHTRLPVYQNSIEQLLGIIHVRDVLNLALDDNLNKTTLLAHIQAPYFVPEGTPLNIQLANFQKEKKRSCFVVNEYGDLLGLAVMENIFEEVVGEFTTDVSTLGKDIVQQPDKSMIIDAGVTLRQIKQTLGWKLPSLGPRTLNGLIIEYLGYIPPAGCCLRIKQFQIEILKVGDNTIKTVRMEKIVIARS